MKGGGVAGVVTVGAADVEVARRRTRSCRSCPTSTAAWVFIIAALAGITVTMYAHVED